MNPRWLGAFDLEISKIPEAALALDIQVGDFENPLDLRSLWTCSLDVAKIIERVLARRIQLEDCGKSRIGAGSGLSTWRPRKFPKERWLWTFTFGDCEILQPALGLRSQLGDCEKTRIRVGSGPSTWRLRK